MKKILLVTLTVFLLFGCQKTPNSPIVVGKNTDLMLEKAQQGRNETIEGSIDTDLYKRLGAPVSYNIKLNSNNGKLNVFVDAEVNLPKGEIPIVRVCPTIFSMEQVKTFSIVLLGETPYYIENPDNKSKGIINREITRLQTIINNWNLEDSPYTSSYETLSEAESSLRELQLQESLAPETIPLITPSFSWLKPHVWTSKGIRETSDTYISLWCMKDVQTQSRLDVYNLKETSNDIKLQYWRDTFDGLSVISTETFNIDESKFKRREEAQQIAETAIRQMRLDGFVCSNVFTSAYEDSTLGTTSIPVYDFIFMRSINNVVETYTNENASADGYAKPWQYEKVHVFVDKDGILYVEYSAPYKILETVMTETNLMPFSEIMDIFEKMVLVVNNTVDNGSGGSNAKHEYRITAITLGLVSIREQNAETGLLVPAWDFLGHEVHYDSSGNLITLNSNNLEPFLTINAIDGTIIERGEGY